MIETQIREPVDSVVPSEAREALPYPVARLALTVAGSVLVALNVALRMMGGGGEAIPVVLWGSAAVCFVASFILLMTEAPASAAKAAENAEPVGAPGSMPTRDLDPVAASDQAKAVEERKEPVLVPRGNPARLLRGGAPTLLASIAALILMGHEGQLRWGVPLGTLLVALACFWRHGSSRYV
jgi:hypothetical protein